LDISRFGYQIFKNSPTNYVGCQFSFWDEKPPKGNIIFKETTTIVITITNYNFEETFENVSPKQPKIV
jgi:hypothetical protein